MCTKKDFPLNDYQIADGDDLQTKRLFLNNSNASVVFPCAGVPDIIVVQTVPQVFIRNKIPATLIKHKYVAFVRITDPNITMFVLLFFMPIHMDMNVYNIETLINLYVICLM